MIFGTFFTVSSKTHILSIFYQILSVWGLHFGTVGTTFWDLFFRSQKMQNIFLQLAPGWRPSSTPRGEGELGGICEETARQGARGETEETGREEVDRCQQPNANITFIF